jgi:hypothetical protein
VISWLEGVLVLLAGVIIGCVIGRAGAYAAFRLLGEATAIEPAIPLHLGELSIPASIFLAGSLGALVTAIAENRK